MQHEHYGPDEVASMRYELRYLRAEIERLRAALKEIADDPGGYPAEDAFSEIRDIARRALEQKAGS